jgi:hypothetical protein
METENYNNLNDNNTYNISQKMDTITIIKNNLILQIIFGIILFCSVFNFLTFLFYLCKKSGFFSYCKEMSPIRRINRKKGITIELGTIRHNLKNETN